jgi:chemotaxis protein histidine kinase CheA
VEAVTGSRNGTPDSVLSPLANVLTQTDRVGQMARSIPREHADPIEAVRAVNRVADDLARASTELKRTVLASRARALHEVLVEGASLVANIAGQHGKDLRAEVHGGHIDIDEAVLGRLRQPLLAIVHRVAMDGVRSGVEGPVVIGLTADAESSHVRISVVGASAPGACIGEDLETARAGIEAMGGAMEFTADPSEGQAVVVRVPSNLAFLDAMVVRIGGTTCAIPTAQVEEVVMPTTAQITMVGTARAIQLRRATVPLLDGGEVLNGTPSTERARYVVVVRGGGRRVALAVDRALGRQQVVVRPVDPALAESAPILAAASVADGSPAVVLDVPGLIRAAGARASVGVAA